MDNWELELRSSSRATKVRIKSISSALGLDGAAFVAGNKAYEIREKRKQGRPKGSRTLSRVDRYNDLRSRRRNRAGGLEDE